MAVYELSVPAADVEVPAGRWVISVMGVALFAFALWGNRHSRARMTGGGQTREPTAPR